MPVEGGGAYVGPGQDRVLALIKELGLSTFKTYVEGKTIYLRNGTRATYDGTIPPLSPDALGGCAQPAMVQRTTWDPGFDVDASIAAKRVVRARPRGPAASAGLRDSMTILGADITRGDPTRQIRLRVSAGTDTTRIQYLPAGPTVAVQQWSRTSGCVP